MTMYQIYHKEKEQWLDKVEVYKDEYGWVSGSATAFSPVFIMDLLSFEENGLAGTKFFYAIRDINALFVSTGGWCYAIAVPIVRFEPVFAGAVELA